MTLSDGIMILAVLVGPILAVQAQEYISRKRLTRDRKAHIFRTLMATRAENLSTVHVEALNMIDLEFYGGRTREKDVRNSWKIYLDHLGDRSIPVNVWFSKRLDLLTDLLHNMAQCLDYDFDKTQIKNACYSPGAHGDRERENTIIRKGFADIFSGKISLPMKITNLPSPEDSEKDEQKTDDTSK